VLPRDRRPIPRQHPIASVRALVTEGPSTDERLVQSDTKAELIGTRVGLLPEVLLWCHVLTSSQQLTWGCCQRASSKGRFECLGNAEIDDLRQRQAVPLYNENV